jgi:hypothetical protein
MSALHLGVVHGDLLAFDADVVVVKHAQAFYAADGAVAERLVTLGCTWQSLEVAPGRSNWVETRGTLKSPLSLFLGTGSVSKLGYHEIRQLAVRLVTSLEERPGVRHVACTTHGVGFGLDEDESVLALVGGLVDAFQRGLGPASLERITVVEKREGRARRMQVALQEGLGATPGVSAQPGGGFLVQRQQGFLAAPALASAGTSSSTKPHAFVAMPFLPELEDVFHYAILASVKGAGLLCERVDQAVFDGLIIERIRERIETARVVVADLSYSNPNVYLEVGYAWGRQRPVILCVRDVNELRFDVKGHRCLVYRSIRELEGLLARELAAVLGPNS